MRMLAVKSWLARLARDERGVAAIEAAAVGSLLSVTLLNAVEIGRYAYTTTQVAAAAQAGAQGALIACPTDKTPATLECPELQTAVTTALQGSSLGDDIRRHGDLHEAWQCINASGQLQEMASAGSRPDDCSGAGDPAQKPGLYLRVQTEYQYQPIFPGLTLAQGFDSVIIRSAWIRML